MRISSAVALSRTDDPRCLEDTRHGTCEGRYQVVADHIHYLQVDGRDGIYYAGVAELIKRIIGSRRPISGVEAICGRIVEQLEQRRPIVYRKVIFPGRIGALSFRRRYRSCRSG